MTDNTKLSRSERVVNFVTLWFARLGLAVLAVAGCVHLLGGVDPVIVYPVSVGLVALLLKETL